MVVEPNIPDCSVKMSLLSVVVPAYNEENSLPVFHQRLSEVLSTLTMPIEVVYVNDGSSDRTRDVIGRITATDHRVAVVHLSRNFGKEIASTAGLDHSRGDAVVLMDADLQHPPELIPIFIDNWNRGYDVVSARRESRETESALKRLFVRAFYMLIQKTSRVEIPQGASDFRLFSRRAIEALRQCRERHRFMKGLFAWIGYPQITVPYTPGPRYAGDTKWNFRQLWTFAIEGITSFSIAPLKLATYIGITAAMLAFVHAGVILYRAVFYGDPVPGYPSLLAVISFLGGIQLITTGILGEYLGRMFEETKQRPLYIVEEYTPSAAAKLADTVDGVDSTPLGNQPVDQSHREL